MDIAQKVVGYLIRTYDPETIILYGSYADGSNGPDSDFDALVIAENAPTDHDTGVVEGVRLDVFIYSPEETMGDIDPDAFMQVFDGNIVVDKNGRGKQLKDKVLAYIDSLPLKTREEKAEDIDWCLKMLRRCERKDAEGLYRWHWLLTDSLQIYMDLKGRHYFGPKKALRYMEKEDSEAFGLYRDALSFADHASLEKWIGFLSNMQ